MTTLLRLGYLIDPQHGTEIVVRTGVQPVAEAAIAAGFAQFAAWIVGIGRGGAGHGHPEGHAAVGIAPKVAACIAATFGARW